MPESLVRDYMSPSVVRIGARAPLQRAAALMCEARVSCLVVCDDDDTPLGVLTERDLTRAYARDAGVAAPRPVASAMSRGVHTVAPDACCDTAMRLLHEHGIRRLVVVDARGRLTGVITQTDLLRAHAEQLAADRARLEQRVQARTRELRALNTRLESLARIDPMLSIGNRRAMDDDLDRLESRAMRHRRPYAVALLDVDHFKDFNDHYGHDGGDRALCRVAAALRHAIRDADAVYRYGGEEFLVVFPDVGAEDAAVAAERLRAAIEALGLAHARSPFGHVSVSVGVAAEDVGDPCRRRLLRRADTALYAAKRGGRNRVERAGGDGAAHGTATVRAARADAAPQPGAASCGS